MKYLFILGLILFTSVACAIDLNPLFTDHMVLQRDMPIRIYGTGQPGEKISVSFANQEGKAEVDADGKWLVILEPQPTSLTGRDLIIKSSNNIIEKTIKNVLIGDVWVCAGQSNMGWALRQTLPLPETFPQAERLRLLKSVTPNGKSTPQEKLTIHPDFNNSWQQSSEEYALKFSAVSYYFGKNVVENTDVPVGLIQIALGGTNIQSWMPMAFHQGKD